MVENNREYPKRWLRERDWKRAINQRMFFFTYYAALLGKICEKKALEKILVTNKLIMVDKILILISAFYYFRITFYRHFELISVLLFMSITFRDTVIL